MAFLPSSSIYESENVDPEPSLQMHKLPSVLFFAGRGVGGQGTLFFGGGGGGRVGYTLHKGQHSL